MIVIEDHESFDLTRVTPLEKSQENRKIIITIECLEALYEKVYLFMMKLNYLALFFVVFYY